MRTAMFLSSAILFVTLFASGQDWQHCESQSQGSFQQLKDAVRRVATMHGYSGWDEKAFNRFGDMVSVAILQDFNDVEMTAPQTLRDLLVTIRLAFACPSTCVVVPDDRKPRVTLLLLGQLHNHTRGPNQLAVDDTRKFVLKQVPNAD
ncbi:MAG TPA: hypothetical protein VEI01_19495 [Terriglobales bacterium]|nr:hypothetical protein [Terriglobales bacterium]